MNLLANPKCMAKDCGRFHWQNCGGRIVKGRCKQYVKLSRKVCYSKPDVVVAMYEKFGSEKLEKVPK